VSTHRNQWMDPDEFDRRMDARRASRYKQEPSAAGWVMAAFGVVMFVFVVWQIVWGVMR
jgi:hypothetical protein